MQATDSPQSEKLPVERAEDIALIAVCSIVLLTLLTCAGTGVAAALGLF